MTHKDHDLLISGAGPTGLAAALFLSQRGIRIRIIDMLEAPAPHSRAQVVNPRSLELLEPSGVAERLLQEGRAFKGVRFYDEWRHLAQLEFDRIHPRFPMLAIPQARTETILNEAVCAQGIEVERGQELTSFAQTSDLVRADVRRAGDVTQIDSRLLLAADGAHSTVRKGLETDFVGSTFAEPWPLFDVCLQTNLDPDYAHVSFNSDGLVFLLKIGDDAWRVFGNLSEPLSSLPLGTCPGQINWQSKFHVSHRVAAREAEGRIVLAGDAAHIHSPVAARGMNLGIEDAAAFAAAAERFLGGDVGAINRYADERHRLHKSVVKRIERLTFLARGKPTMIGTLRRHFFPIITHVGPIASGMIDLVTGLDHPSPLR
jgi:2-polyprenyl-6-methoxyphenol hydroxylase-like FAD-dependent oxidoreductase